MPETEGEMPQQLRLQQAQHMAFHLIEKLNENDHEHVVNDVKVLTEQELRDVLVAMTSLACNTGRSLARQLRISYN